MVTQQNCHLKFLKSSFQRSKACLLEVVLNSPMWPSKGGEGLSPLFQSDNFTLKGFEPEVKLRNPAYFVIFGTISDLFWPYIWGQGPRAGHSGFLHFTRSREAFLHRLSCPFFSSPRSPRINPLGAEHPLERVTRILVFGGLEVSAKLKKSARRSLAVPRSETPLRICDLYRPINACVNRVRSRGKELCRQKITS